MRKDARENRDRLIQAAKDVMSEHGVDVPLEIISKRAGTTRGTLYRNFADRTELFRAVLDSELRSVTDSISEAEARDVSTGVLHDDGKQLSRLIGRPTTSTSEAVSAALSASVA